MRSIVELENEAAFRVQLQVVLQQLKIIMDSSKAGSSAKNKLAPIREKVDLWLNEVSTAAARGSVASSLTTTAPSNNGQDNVSQRVSLQSSAHHELADTVKLSDTSTPNLSCQGNSPKDAYAALSASVSANMSKKELALSPSMSEAHLPDDVRMQRTGVSVASDMSSATDVLPDRDGVARDGRNGVYSSNSSVDYENTQGLEKDVRCGVIKSNMTSSDGLHTAVRPLIVYSSSAVGGRSIVELADLLEKLLTTGVSEDKKLRPASKNVTRVLMVRCMSNITAALQHIMRLTYALGTKGRHNTMRKVSSGAIAQDSEPTPGASVRDSAQVDVPIITMPTTAQDKQCGATAETLTTFVSDPAAGRNVERGSAVLEGVVAHAPVALVTSLPASKSAAHCPHVRDDSLPVMLDTSAGNMEKTHQHGTHSNHVGVSGDEESKYDKVNADGLPTTMQVEEKGKSALYTSATAFHDSVTLAQTPSVDKGENGAVFISNVTNNHEEDAGNRPTRVTGARSASDAAHDKYVDTFVILARDLRQSSQALRMCLELTMDHVDRALDSELSFAVKMCVDVLRQLRRELRSFATLMDRVERQQHTVDRPPMSCGASCTPPDSSACAAPSGQSHVGSTVSAARLSLSSPMESAQAAYHPLTHAASASVSAAAAAAAAGQQTTQSRIRAPSCHLSSQMSCDERYVATRVQQLRRWWRPALCRALQSVDEVVQPALRFLVLVVAMRETASSTSMSALRQLARDELFQLCEPLLCRTRGRPDAVTMPSSSSLASSTAATVLPHAAASASDSASSAVVGGSASSTASVATTDNNNTTSPAAPPPPPSRRESHREGGSISGNTLRILLELQCCYDATCLSAMAELCGDDNDGCLIATRIVADGVAFYGEGECRALLPAMLRHGRWSTPLLRGILVCVLSSQMPVLRAGLNSLRILVHACAGAGAGARARARARAERPVRGGCTDEDDVSAREEDVCGDNEGENEGDDDRGDGVSGFTEGVGLLYTHGVFPLLESENCPAHAKRALLRHVIQTFLIGGAFSPLSSCASSSPAPAPTRAPPPSSLSSALIHSPPSSSQTRPTNDQRHILHHTPLLLHLYAASDLDVHAHRVNLIQQLVTTLARTVRCAAISELACDSFAVRRLLAKIAEPPVEPVRLCATQPERHHHACLPSLPTTTPSSCFTPAPVSLLTDDAAQAARQGHSAATQRTPAHDTTTATTVRTTTTSRADGAASAESSGTTVNYGDVFEEDEEWVAWTRLVSSSSSSHVSNTSAAVSAEPSLAILALYALRRVTELLMPRVSLDDLLVCHRRKEEQRGTDVVPRLLNRDDKLVEQRLADVFNNAPLKAVVQLFDVQPAEMDAAAVSESFARCYDRASLPRPTLAQTREKVRSAADFLFDLSSSLDGEGVAEFLSSPALFPLQVCADFMSRLSLTGCGVCEALRELLLQIPLPKEGQRIERLLEYFSTAYYEANSVPGIDRQIFPFEEASSCFVVVVATIMLNTNLHNPNAGTHMSCSSFVSQLKTCVKTPYFTDSFAQIIYYQIRHGYLDLARQSTNKGGAAGTGTAESGTHRTSAVAVSANSNSTHASSDRVHVPGTAGYRIGSQSSQTNSSSGAPASSFDAASRGSASYLPGGGGGGVPHKSSSDTSRSTSMGINALFISTAERQRIALATECQRTLAETGEMLRFARRAPPSRQTAAAAGHDPCCYARGCARSSHALRQHERLARSKAHVSSPTQPYAQERGGGQRQSEAGDDASLSAAHLNTAQSPLSYICCICYCCDAEERYCRARWWAAVAHDLLIVVWPSLYAVFARHVENCCKTIPTTLSTGSGAAAMNAHERSSGLTSRSVASRVATPAECVLLQCVHGLKQLLYLSAAHRLPRECEITLSALMRPCSCAPLQRECRAMILTAAASSYALHFSVMCWRSIAALMMACRAESQTARMVPVVEVLTRVEAWTAQRHLVERRRAAAAATTKASSSEADSVHHTHGNHHTRDVHDDVEERAHTARTPSTTTHADAAAVCTGEVERVHPSDASDCEEAAAVRRCLQGVFSLLRDVRPGDARNVSAGLYLVSRILEYTVIAHDGDVWSGAHTPADDAPSMRVCADESKAAGVDGVVRRDSGDVAPVDASHVGAGATSVGNYINVSDLYSIVLPEFVMLMQRHGGSEESMRVCTEFMVNTLETTWVRYAFGAASTSSFTASPHFAAHNDHTTSNNNNNVASIHAHTRGDANRTDSARDEDSADPKEEDTWVACYDVFRRCYLQSGSSSQAKLYILQAVKELMARMIHKTRVIHGRYSPTLHESDTMNTTTQSRSSDGPHVDATPSAPDSTAGARSSSHEHPPSHTDSPEDSERAHHHSNNSSSSSNNASCMHDGTHMEPTTPAVPKSPLLCTRTAISVWRHVLSPAALAMQSAHGVATETSSLGVLVLRHLTLLAVGVTVTGGGAAASASASAHRDDDSMAPRSAHAHAASVAVDARNAPMQRVLLILLSNLAYLGLQCSDVDTAQSCLGPLTTLCTHAFRMMSRRTSSEKRTSGEADAPSQKASLPALARRALRRVGSGGDCRVHRDATMHDAFWRSLWGGGAVVQDGSASPPSAMTTTMTPERNGCAVGAACVRESAEEDGGDGRLVAMHILERLCALLRSEREVTRTDCLQILSALVTDLSDEALAMVAQSVSCAILSGVVAGGGGAPGRSSGQTGEESFYTCSVYRVAVVMLRLAPPSLCTQTPRSDAAAAAAASTLSAHTDTHTRTSDPARAGVMHDQSRTATNRVCEGVCTEPRYASRRAFQPTLSRAITFLTQNVIAAATPPTQPLLMQYLIHHCLLPVMVLCSHRYPACVPSATALHASSVGAARAESSPSSFYSAAAYASASALTLSPSSSFAAEQRNTVQVNNRIPSSPTSTSSAPVLRYDAVPEESQLTRCLAARALMQAASPLLLNVSPNSTTTNTNTTNGVVTSLLHTSGSMPRHDSSSSSLSSSSSTSTSSVMDTSPTTALLLCVLNAVSVMLCVMAPPMRAVAPWSLCRAAGAASTSSVCRDDRSVLRETIAKERCKRAACRAPTTRSCEAADSYAAEVARYVNALSCARDVCQHVLGCAYGTLAWRQTRRMSAGVHESDPLRPGDDRVGNGGGGGDIAQEMSTHADAAGDGMHAPTSDRDRTMPKERTSDTVIHSSRDYDPVTRTSANKIHGACVEGAALVTGGEADGATAVMPVGLNALTDMIVLLTYLTSPLPRLLAQVDLSPLAPRGDSCTRSHPLLGQRIEEERTYHANHDKDDGGTLAVTARYPPATTIDHLVHLFRRAATVLFAVMLRLSHPHCTHTWLQSSKGTRERAASDDATGFVSGPAGASSITALMPHTALRGVLGSYFALVVYGSDDNDDAVSMVLCDTLSWLRILCEAQRGAAGEESAERPGGTRADDARPMREAAATHSPPGSARRGEMGGPSGAAVGSGGAGGRCGGGVPDGCDRVAEAQARQAQSPLLQQHLRACHVGVYHELSVVLNNWLSYLVLQSVGGTEVESGAAKRGARTSPGRRVDSSEDGEHGSDGAAGAMTAAASPQRALRSGVRGLVQQRVRAIRAAAAATPELAMVLMELLTPTAGPMVIAMVRRYMTWYMTSIHGVSGGGTEGSAESDAVVA